MKKIYLSLMIAVAIIGSACLHGCGSSNGNASGAHTVYGATS